MDCISLAIHLDLKIKKKKKNNHLDQKLTRLCQTPTVGKIA